METIVETKNLTKRFGDKVAVNNVSMHIERGDIYGFIGKNGAGKTSTMKLLLGMSYPTSGDIQLFGSNQLDKMRIKIGSLIEAPGLYKNCTAYENLKRYSLIFGGSNKEIKEILEIVGLGNTGNKKAGAFSLGMRQRLGIAIALLGNPELLILDEPINGLDPAGIKEIRDLILRLNKERKITVLVSSHLLDELSKIVTKYGIINNGHLVEEISAAELAHRCRKNLSIECDNVREALLQIKKSYPFAECDVKGNTIMIYSDIENKSSLNKLLVNAGVGISKFAEEQSGFEDYFIERIGV
ncbi:MAG: ABC transporter ATP-binding protein [Anaeroplasma bactoclasticum]|nr:ABC transporter ATP-binding protein [Anaeroplasma bactoclasticum]MCM1557004.1 ABC transporter ATP-binding protein [Anaeroplasma bactoclasticum]